VPRRNGCSLTRFGLSSNPDPCQSEVVIAAPRSRLAALAVLLATTGTGCCLTIVSGIGSPSESTTGGTSAATSGATSGGATSTTTTGGVSSTTTTGGTTGATTTGGQTTGGMPDSGPDAGPDAGPDGGMPDSGFDAGRCLATTVFAPVVTYTVGAAPFGIQVADLDGNGKPDLAVSDIGQGMVWILPGRGDGTFDPAVGYLEGGASYALTTADFNHDGVADLAVANTAQGSVSVLLGDGDGGFGPPQSFSAGEAPNCVIATDLNGDGEIDLVVSNYNAGMGTTVSVMLGEGDGGFAPPAGYSVGAGAIFVVTDDFNADGIPDLLAASQGGNSLALLLGVGDGTFASAQPFGASAGTAPTSIGLGNFNGSLGAAVTDWFGNSVAILAGPVAATEQPAIINLGSNPNSVAVADFDGDGILDLAVAEANSFSSTAPGTIDLLIGKGDGTFEPPVTFAVGPSSVTVVAADLNGDGKPDLAVADQSGSVSILLNACP